MSFFKSYVKTEWKQWWLQEHETIVSGYLTLSVKEHWGPAFCSWSPCCPSWVSSSWVCPPRSQPPRPRHQVAAQSQVLLAARSKPDGSYGQGENLEFWFTRCGPTVCWMVPSLRSDLGLVGLSLGLPRQAAWHGVDLALAARHAVENVDVEVLLDDVPDLVVLTLLQVPLEQLVGVARDAQHKLAGPEIQQGLVASHVLPLG